MEFYLYSLILIPLVASRAMMTICGSALAAYVAANPETLPFIELDIDVEAAGLIIGLPEWMISIWFICLTFTLAIVENIVSRSPELQEFWNMTEAKLKGIFSFLICFVLINGDPQVLVEHVKTEGISTGFGGFFSVEYVWSFGVGLLTWLLCIVRSGVYRFLIEIDDSDSLGIRTLLGRMENALGLIGPAIFIVYPMVAFAAAGAALLILVGMNLWVKRLENRHSAECPSCQHINHLSALSCGKCSHSLADVKAVGFMGLAKDEPRNPDTQQHKLDLLRVKRCPECASVNKEKSVGVVCSVCNTPYFRNPSELDSFLKAARKRLGKTLVVTSILGLLPIVGLIPGIIFYRLYLVAGLKGYVSSSSNFLFRLLLSVLFLILIIYQATPVIGFAAIPIMALANFLLYSRRIKSQVRQISSQPDELAQGI